MNLFFHSLSQGALKKQELDAACLSLAALIWLIYEPCVSKKGKVQEYLVEEYHCLRKTSKRKRKG